MMNTRRREFLTLTVGAAGAAGAAAFVPAFLGTQVPAVALAQGNAPNDPLLNELLNQFNRLNAGLAASPPRGNAHQIAAAYRMMAAWMQSNKIDEQLKQAVNTAVAREGRNFVTRLASTDVVAMLKAQGIAVPAGFSNPTYADAAKAVGYVRAQGWTLSGEFKRRARLIEAKADQLNRQLAIRNGQQPDMQILRVQNPEGRTYGDGFIMDCGPFNPDTGEQTCTYTPVEGDILAMWAEACSNAALILLIVAVLAAGICFASTAGACLGLMVTEGMWGFLMWYVGC